MTAADIKALGYRVYEAINDKRHRRLGNSLIPTLSGMRQEKQVSRALKKALLNAFATFPGKRFVVEDLIAEGDKVALECGRSRHPNGPRRASAYHHGDLRIENGRVVEVWGAGTSRRPGA